MHINSVEPRPVVSPEKPRRQASRPHTLDDSVLCFSPFVGYVQVLLSFKIVVSKVKKWQCIKWSECQGTTWSDQRTALDRLHLRITFVNLAKSLAHFECKTNKVLMKDLTDRGHIPAFATDVMSVPCHDAATLFGRLLLRACRDIASLCRSGRVMSGAFRNLSRWFDLVKRAVDKIGLVGEENQGELSALAREGVDAHTHVADHRDVGEPASAYLHFNPNVLMAVLATLTDVHLATENATIRKTGTGPTWPLVAGEFFTR